MINSSNQEGKNSGFVRDEYRPHSSDEEAWRIIEKTDVTPANVRWGSRRVIINSVVQNWIQGEEISLEATKALLSRTVGDLIRYCEYEKSPPEVIWPQMSGINHADNKFLSIRLQADNNYIIPKGNSIFPKGLSNFDDYDPLETVSFIAASRLNSEDQKKVIQCIMNLESIVPELDLFDFNAALLLLFMLKAKDPNSVFGVVADFIYNHKDKYTYKLSPFGWGKGETYVDEIMMALAISGRDSWLVKYLSDCKDDEKVKKILGMFVDVCDFPRIINSVRSYIIKTGDKKVKRIGKLLLGRNPEDDSIPFHKLLEEVYRSIDFENYAPNLEVNEFELNAIDQLLQQEGLGEGAILDLACGTGRIANGLAMKGYNHIIGVDISDDNLRKAKDSDSTRKVDYRNADIKNLELDDDSIDAVIFIGRSSTHAESEKVFRDWLGEIKRVLKPNGIVLVDFPDRNKGEIYKSRKDYIHLLQKLGIPISAKEGSKAYNYLVDSPDGRNLYNRWIPPVNLIKRIFESQGFDIEVYLRRRIANKKGDENIYFLARNIRQKNPDWITGGAKQDDYWIPF